MKMRGGIHLSTSANLKEDLTIQELRVIWNKGYIQSLNVFAEAATLNLQQNELMQEHTSAHVGEGDA